jgi:protein-L-isoaspartate(D-aspartate) O-methyltransferase
MVRDQLIPRGIKNERVLDAMRRVPRQMFVDEHLKKMAYDDYPLPIGEEQTISQPYMVAAMTEALEPHGEDRVLEIGTGSGYQTAVLAELVHEVFTVERISSLARRASEALLELGYSNIHFKTGDGTRGWSEHAPFDKTLVTAGSPGVPEELFRQLRDRGRMVIPIGDTYSQVLTIVVKDGEKLKKEKLFSCIFVPLVGEDGWGDFIGA